MYNTSKVALAVGVTGFEPATTWSQTRCATGLRYAPFCGAKLHILCEMCKTYPNSRGIVTARHMQPPSAHVRREMLPLLHGAYSKGV